MEHRYFWVGAPAMTTGQILLLLGSGGPVGPLSVADRKDMPLLSEDDFESSLHTVCEAAAGSIEGVFGPASLTWRVRRAAAPLLCAGRPFFPPLAPPPSPPSPPRPSPALPL